MRFPRSWHDGIHLLPNAIAMTGACGDTLSVCTDAVLLMVTWAPQRRRSPYAQTTVVSLLQIQRRPHVTTMVAIPQRNLTSSCMKVWALTTLVAFRPRRQLYLFICGVCVSSALGHSASWLGRNRRRMCPVAAIVTCSRYQCSRRCQMACGTRGIATTDRVFWRVCSWPSMACTSFGATACLNACLQDLHNQMLPSRMC